MPRNLVVCLDGTDNQFSAHNTNVVRLFQALAHSPTTQIAYYDPGVGTIWEPGTLSKTSQKVQMLLGLAFGLGVSQNVSDAYAFLAQTYQPGDRLFLFGFSRGALEARALAAMLYRVGLLEPQLLTLEPYAMRLFQHAGDFPVVGGFKKTFSRPVTIEFLGLWDTVTSMGNVWSPIHWPNTARNPAVQRVAHAIAIDERRAFFRQNRWTTLAHQHVAEFWFAGVHSDVGGGYDANTGRLWAITLDWMIREVGKVPSDPQIADLAFDPARLAAVLGTARSSEPDFATNQHDSMTTFWKPAELVPRRSRRRRDDGDYEPAEWTIPALTTGFKGRPRRLAPGEHVHRTAIERFAKWPWYRPPTLTEAGLDLAEAERFLRTTDETWVVGQKLPVAPPPPERPSPNVGGVGTG